MDLKDGRGQGSIFESAIGMKTDFFRIKSVESVCDEVGGGGEWV